jgi:hypothetical protein
MIRKYPSSAPLFMAKKKRWFAIFLIISEKIKIILEFGGFGSFTFYDFAESG